MASRQVRRLLLAAVIALAAAPASAQTKDDDWGNDGDPGFEDFPDIKVEPKLEVPSPFNIRGFLRSDWALWAERFKDNPFAQGRQSLDLVMTYKQRVARMHLGVHGEYDFAYLHERESYDRPTLRTYEFDMRPRELYWAFSLGRAELTIGRQIVVWGEGDAISPLDVVNPRDLRDPGLADLDDLRLPVLATRVGIFLGNHRIEGMVVHEGNFGLRSPPFGPWSPFRAILAQGLPGVDLGALIGDRQVVFDDVQDRFDWGNSAYYLRWVYKGPGIDVGLYGAYTQDQQGVISLPPLPELLTADRIRLSLDHQHDWVVGTSGAWAWRQLLLKWEVGAEIGKPLNVGQPPTSLSVAYGSILNLMLAVNYSPLNELPIVLEVNVPVALDEPKNLLFPIDKPQIALRASWRTLRERLQLMVAFTMFGIQAELGWFLRGEISYEIQDGLKVGLWYITYQPGEDEVGPFLGLDTHDRLFWKLRWDFTVL